MTCARGDWGGRLPDKKNCWVGWPDSRGLDGLGQWSVELVIVAAVCWPSRR
jgi:hypothetical protein